MASVTLAIASAGYSCAMNTRDRVARASARRAVPELVVAQVAGAVAGLLLAYDQFVAPAPKRPRIVDRDLTRC